MTRIIYQGDFELDEISEKHTGFSTYRFHVFKIIVSLISDMTDEVNFNFTEDGLSIGCMDSGHISYLYIS